MSIKIILFFTAKRFGSCLARKNSWLINQLHTNFSTNCWLPDLTPSSVNFKGTNENYHRVRNQIPPSRRNCFRMDDGNSCSLIIILSRDLSRTPYLLTPITQIYCNVWVYIWSTIFFFLRLIITVFTKF